MLPFKLARPIVEPSAAEVNEEVGKEKRAGRRFFLSPHWTTSRPMLPKEARRLLSCRRGVARKNAGARKDPNNRPETRPKI
jgi:hypothetical protein